MTVFLGRHRRSAAGMAAAVPFRQGSVRQPNHQTSRPFIALSRSEYRSRCQFDNTSRSSAPADAQIVRAAARRFDRKPVPQRSISGGGDARGGSRSR